MTTWRTKEALNETRFRVQNEWTSEAPGSFTGADATTAFLCGRGDADCMNPVELTRAEYELVRSHPTHFLIEKAPVSIGGAKPVGGLYRSFCCGVGRALVDGRSAPRCPVCGLATPWTAIVRSIVDPKADR